MSSVPPGRGPNFLSGNPDLTRRERLLLAATELFVARERHDRQEIRAFCELAVNLYDGTDVADRRRIACLAARASDIPAEFLELLARDEDALVAYPVVLHAAMISTQAQLLIAERGPESLRRALIRREDLVPAAQLVLARHADPASLGQLLPRIDLAARPEILAVLSSRADVMAGIGPELAARALLPTPMLLANFPFLDHDNRLLAVGAAELRALGNLTRQGGKRPPRLVFKPALLQRLRAAALSGGHQAFAEGLAYALGLEAALALRLTTDEQGEALVICLKVLGFDSENATAMLVRLGGITLDLARLRKLQHLFENISLDAAHCLLTSWRHRTEIIEGEIQQAAAARLLQPGGARAGHRPQDLARPGERPLPTHRPAPRALPSTRRLSNS